MRYDHARTIVILTALTMLARAAFAGTPASRPVASLNAGRAGDPFVPVFVDSATEKALGPFPYDRALYAKAIERAHDLGAKGVVIKFFLDKPKSPDGDRALARAMSATRVILQARIDDSEPTPNDLPDRFRLPVQLDPGDRPINCKSGWLPMPDLAAAAHDIGLVDHRVITRMPVVERYRDRYVKSLYLCCVEMALGERATITPGQSVRIASKTIALDARSEVGVDYPAKDEITFVSFADFVAGKSSVAVKDRVVILAYDGDKFEPIETPMGKVRPHRAFYYALMSIYRQFQPD